MIRQSSKSSRSELFGDGSGVHKVGKGTVYAGQNLGEVFRRLHLNPDFDYSKHNSDSDLRIRSPQAQRRRHLFRG